MNRPIRTLAAGAGLAVIVSLLAGCSGSSPLRTVGNPAAGPPSVTLPAGGGQPPAGEVSSASIRVANLFAPNGAAGPALDIYDVSLHGSAATPILTGVAFGTVSAYAHPHVLGGGVQKVAEFEAMPAGEDPTTKYADALQIGGLIDDGSGAQITIRVSWDSGGLVNGPLAGLSESQFIEKGDDGQGGKGPLAPAPDAGKGELLADDSLVPADGHTSVYLMIDDSCDPPVNGDPNVTGVPEIFAADSATIVSPFAIFPTAPGTHQVSVVSWQEGTTPTCADLTDRQAATSVDVTAGQQVVLFVYGPADHLGVAAAAVQN